MNTLLRVATAVLAASGLAAAQAWNHNPTSPIGPLHWGTVAPSYATCGDSVTGEVGKKQTPIDIVPANAVMIGIAAPQFKYKPTPFIVENTGHVVEVQYEPDSYIYIGSQPTDAYKLLQFHFHAPSEHTINGVSYPAELHLVHQNAIGELAVVGVMLSSSPTGLSSLSTLMAAAPTTVGEFNAGGTINAMELLPTSNGFYRYAGSLTTPACSESVQWFVMKTPVPIKPEALTALHKVISLFPNYNGYPNNNRPVAPLNGRTVLQDFGWDFGGGKRGIR